jgi:hypothetical protein
MVELLLLAGKDNLTSARRRIKRKRVLVIGGGEIPVEDYRIFRPRLVRRRRQHELPGKWKITLLDPHLPIQAFLTECVLLTGRVLNIARAEIDRSRDLRPRETWIALEEKINERKLYVELLFQHVGQLPYRAAAIAIQRRPIRFSPSR